MDLQQVMERVRLMTGDEREALLMTLCTDAVRELEAMLVCSDDEQAEYAEALCAAAAARAVYKLLLLDAAQSPDSLTAGNVRAEFKYNCAQAKLYLEQCMRVISPILQDDSFYFGGVPCAK